MKSLFIAAGILCLASLSKGLPQEPLAPPDQCYGVIELGAKGIKPLVVASVGKDSTGILLPPKKLEEFKPKNKNPYDGDTAAQVASEVDSIEKAMMDKYHMPAEQIYVVESSGIPDKVKKTLQENLSGAIIPDYMDVARESRLVFQGIVPPNRMKLNDVVVLDIGSGNSKGSYLTKNTSPLEFETFSVPLGTGTFAKKVNGSRQNGEDFKTVAFKVANEEILPSLRSQIRNKPGMQNCSRLYLAGGLPYVLTTLLHPERIGSKDPQDRSGKKTSDWVQLSVTDINEFYDIATKNPADLLKPDLSKVSSENQKLAENETTQAASIFNEDELVAGAILLKTYMDEMHFDRKNAIFFSRLALYAWPQGYVKEKIEQKLASTP
jgi:hypothetical protein